MTKSIAAGMVIAAAGTGVLLGGALDDHSRTTDVSPSGPAMSRQVSSSTLNEPMGSAKSVYDAAKNSVVYIVADTSEGQATGSGFVIDAGGLIATNAHVVGDASSVVVRIGPSGSAQQAQVLARSDSVDLALLRVNPDQPLNALSLDDASNVSVGDPVYAIGSPFGLDQTLTSGIVSATNRTIQGLDGSPINGVIQTDAALNPGNSGGPLLDSHGRVLGINSQIASESGTSDGIGFAIPSSTCKPDHQLARAARRRPATPADAGSGSSREGSLHRPSAGGASAPQQRQRRGSCVPSVSGAASPTRSAETAVASSLPSSTPH